MQKILPSFLLLFLFACNFNSDCDLRKLSDEEIFDRATQVKFIPEDTPYYLETGEYVPQDSFINYNRDEIGFDQYVDCKDSVVKVVIRPITDEDILLSERIDSLYFHNIDLRIQRIKLSQSDTAVQNQMIQTAKYYGPSIISDIDCNHIESQITEAFFEGQANRGKLNLEIDKKHRDLIESIVHHCGFEAIKSFGEDAVFYTFMIIQHSPDWVMENYIDKFKEAAESGYLRKASLVLMIDRVLVSQGKKQIYGTQYRRNIETGEITFDPIVDPENLDERRREVGLGSFEEYKNQILSRRR